MLSALDPLFVISIGYGLPVAATYSVPPLLLPVMPTTFYPLTVVVPLLLSVPWSLSV